MKPRRNLDYWVVMIGCFSPKYSDVTVVVITTVVNVVIITTAQLYSTKPELRFSQIQVLLVVCQRLAMVRTSDYGFGRKYGYTLFVGQPYHKYNSSFIVKHDQSLSFFLIKGYGSGLLGD